MLWFWLWEIICFDLKKRSDYIWSDIEGGEWGEISGSGGMNSWRVILNVKIFVLNMVDFSVIWWEFYGCVNLNGGVVMYSCYVFFV